MTTCAKLLSALCLILAANTVSALGVEWDRYVNPRFGYSAIYPADVFSQSDESQDGEGRTFISADSRAKFIVFATYNTQNISLEQYRATILNNFPGYERLIYGPKGANWFVLSGERGENIYYQKVLFSCGGRVINAFALNYPVFKRSLFDPIVTVIEKNFQSASGRACAYALR